jgi:hypothetical protein
MQQTFKSLFAEIGNDTEGSDQWPETKSAVTGILLQSLY